MIPGSILGRSAKGTPSTHYAAVLMEQQPYLRSLLLTGLLAANAIIECNAIEKAIGDQQIFSDSRSLQLLTIVDAEIWARRWHGRF